MSRLLGQRTLSSTCGLVREKKVIDYEDMVDVQSQRRRLQESFSFPTDSPKANKFSLKQKLILFRSRSPRMKAMKG